MDDNDDDGDDDDDRVVEAEEVATLESLEEAVEKVGVAGSRVEVFDIDVGFDTFEKLGGWREGEAVVA